MNYWSDNIDILSGKKSKQEKRSSKILGTEEGTNHEQPLLLKTKKTGVWSEEETKSSKVKSGHNMIELERFQKDQNEEGDDDIPIIPDIDDLQDDLHNLSDVKKIISVDESTYKELGSQFDNLKNEQVTFGNLGDIDLSFLIGKMYPENEVKPCQEVWTIDSMYKDIAKEFSKAQI